MKLTGESAVYHCMSRTVNGEVRFGAADKETLRKMLWRVADFSGVDILTYCLMSNHFHILVRVPEKGPVSDSELMRRYRILYPKPTAHAPADPKVLEAQLKAGGEEADKIRRQLLARMGDVSEFMKTLKGRYTRWFNRTHDRYGTLWSERFKSVLVEGRGAALQTVAAYIDLNPARAGLVDDPVRYRFCGYAEAAAGGHRARVGLTLVWREWRAGSGEAGGTGSADAALAAHRSLLFGQGSAPAEGKTMIDRKAALKVLNRGGELPLATALRCRVRYFTDGAVLGSKGFVLQIAARWQVERGRLRPPKAKPLRGADWGDLAVIRGLRRKVFH